MSTMSIHALPTSCLLGMLIVGGLIACKPAPTAEDSVSPLSIEQVHTQTPDLPSPRLSTPSTPATPKLAVTSEVATVKPANVSYESIDTAHQDNFHPTPDVLSDSQNKSQLDTIASPHQQDDHMALDAQDTTQDTIPGITLQLPQGVTSLNDTQQADVQKYVNGVEYSPATRYVITSYYDDATLQDTAQKRVNAVLNTLMADGTWGMQNFRTQVVEDTSGLEADITIRGY